MSTMKERVQHTPGPWTLEGQIVEAHDERYGQSTGIIYIAKMERHRTGAADHVCPDEVQDANADLIAAAPELLTSLQALRTIMATHDLDEEYATAFASAGAAIAKAQP